MSYNIDSTEYVKGTGPLTITDSALAELRDTLGDDTPEDAWTDGGNERRVLSRPNPDGTRNLLRPTWRGEGSGSTYDAFAQSLTYTRGSADIVLTWEGGDSFSGLRVRDGVVTRHKVVMTLGEEEK